MSAVSGFYTFAKGVLTPIMTPWIKFTVTGEENLPAEGGFLLVPNHLSNVDPLCLCWYFMKRDTAVRFLAKKSMFSVPVFGWIIKGMGQIPVNRDSNPSAVLAPTREALKAGEVTAPIFTKVTFDANMGNAYQNATATVDVTAQAVQAANNGKTITEAAGWPNA